MSGVSDLSPGPSGRNPVKAIRIWDSEFIENEPLLVLFEDGTLGTWDKGRKLSTDGSEYSMIFHSNNQLGKIETINKDMRKEKNFLYLQITFYLLSIIQYYYVSRNSGFPDFIAPLEEVMSIFIVLVLFFWWATSNLFEYSDVEIRLFLEDTDPHKFPILSTSYLKVIDLISYIFVIQLISFFAINNSSVYFDIGILFIISMSIIKFNSKNTNWDVNDFITIFENLNEEIKKQVRIENSIISLLVDNESPILEFKASMWTRYKTVNKIATPEVVNNPKKGTNFKDPVLEDEVLHTVAAFLNTGGGTLLIGVKDKPTSWGKKPAEVFGIKNDYKIMGRDQDQDTYVRNVYEVLNRGFRNTSTTASFVNVKIEKYEDKDICRIDVEPLPKIRDGELYIIERSDPKNEDRFYVRIGTSSQKQSISSAARYIRDNFPPPNSIN
jgi:hypothetical protein